MPREHRDWATGLPANRLKPGRHPLAEASLQPWAANISSMVAAHFTECRPMPLPYLASIRATVGESCSTGLPGKEGTSGRWQHFPTPTPTRTSTDQTTDGRGLRSTIAAVSGNVILQSPVSLVCLLRANGSRAVCESRRARKARGIGRRCCYCQPVAEPAPACSRRGHPQSAHAAW